MLAEFIQDSSARLNCYVLFPSLTASKGYHFDFCLSTPFFNIFSKIYFLYLIRFLIIVLYYFFIIISFFLYLTFFNLQYLSFYGGIQNNHSYYKFYYLHLIAIHGHTWNISTRLFCCFREAIQRDSNCRFLYTSIQHTMPFPEHRGVYSL